MLVRHLLDILLFPFFSPLFSIFSTIFFFRTLLFLPSPINSSSFFLRFPLIFNYFLLFSIYLSSLIFSNPWFPLIFIWLPPFFQFALINLYFSQILRFSRFFPFFPLFFLFFSFSSFLFPKHHFFFHLPLLGGGKI